MNKMILVFLLVPALLGLSFLTNDTMAAGSSVKSRIIQSGYGTYMVEKSGKITQLESNWMPRIGKTPIFSKGFYIVFYGSNEYNKTNPTSIDIYFAPWGAWTNETDQGWPFKYCYEYCEKVCNKKYSSDPCTGRCGIDWYPKYALLEDEQKDNIMYLKIKNNQISGYYFVHVYQSFFGGLENKYSFRIK